MARVTPGDIRVLVDTPVTDLAVEFAIENAHDIVEDNIVGDPDAPGADRLARIERWLSVHFLHPMDPSAEEVTIGDVRERYEGSAAGGLGETRAGRAAIQADPTGQLEQIGKTEAIFQSFGHDADDW